MDPPLHTLHSPATKLYPIGQDVHDISELQERSGEQLFPFNAYPPIHEVQLVASVSEHSLQGSLHCYKHLLLTNLKPVRHSEHVPFKQVLHF